MTGKTIRRLTITNPTMNVDIAHLKSGIYIVNLNAEQTSENIKLMKL